MIVTPKFEEGQEVFYYYMSDKIQDKIKMVEIRIMNNKAYIKYRLESGFWKNEEDLIWKD